MTEIIAWSLFLVVLAALVPASRFVERVTGRKAIRSGPGAFVYYAVLGSGTAISMLVIGETLHPSIWAAGALGGVCAGIWSLVAQAARGEKRT